MTPRALQIALLLLLPLLAATCSQSTGVGLFREQGDAIPLARQAALEISALSEAQRQIVSTTFPLMELYDIQPATAFQTTYRWPLDSTREVFVTSREVPLRAADCTALVRPTPAADAAFARFQQQQRRLPGARQAALSGGKGGGLSPGDMARLETEAPRLHYYKLMEPGQTGISAYIWPLEGGREMAVSYPEGSKAGTAEFQVRIYKVKQ